MPGMHYSTYCALQQIREFPTELQEPARKLYFLFEDIEMISVLYFFSGVFGALIGALVLLLLQTPLSIFFPIPVVAIFLATQVSATHLLRWYIERKMGKIASLLYSENFPRQSLERLCEINRTALVMSRSHFLVNDHSDIQERSLT
jgi:hypothetical protein